MTEQQTTEQATGEATDQGTVEAVATTAGDEVVPKSRLEGVAKQAAEWKAKALEYEKLAKQAEAAERQREEAKAVEKGEFDKVLAERERQIEELRQAQSAAERQVREATARAELTAAGMTDPLALRGALADMPADADIAEYVGKLKTDHPGAFAAPKTPVQHSSGGTVSTVVDSTLEARLKSDDPNIRKQAADEELELFLRNSGHA
jgi:hypothetical protein